MLLDSYWYKHQILIRNPPTVSISDTHKDRMKKPSDEIIALMITDCRNDVEVKGLLRFWAHSVASDVS
ncbi:hypothetical protein L1987_71691 [Smallanthus sonchifolius]|uniref:Uncharacterized protein n=1 Tax=Smallanthus sonchifolius TaxID=185202 RepID=A0ACB9ASS1_9ASTR|nr:hypothetical protein L1987_71691 [Smallanthus sonchifolius]